MSARSVGEVARRFVLQREIREPGSRGLWFDAESFETKDDALARLRHRRWEAQARINGRGGSGYTGERVQRMRIIELIPDPAAKALISGVSLGGEDTI